MVAWSIEATTIGLVKAGFPKSVPLLTIATAICWAESAFDPDAVNTNHSDDGTVSHDLGLFQINDHYHADLLAKYNWRDGNQNCRMARIIYLQAGGSWHPWSTYNNGAYKAHLAECKIGVINGLKGDPGEVTGGIGPIPNPIDGIEGILSALGNLIAKIFDPNLWKRIGLGLMGAIVFIIGVGMLIRNDPTVKNTVGTVKSAATMAATKGA